MKTFILKVASRCNLNCDYCYVYNAGDATWKTRPKVMSSETLHAALKSIHAHLVKADADRATITFHGGEPLLVGRDVFASYLNECLTVLGPTVPRLSFQVQTNGTLIDAEWASLLASRGVQVGVSIDGPASIHDAHRRTLSGRPSHRRVLEGVQRLKDAGVEPAALCVIPLGESARRIHGHLREIGFRSIDYLIPDVKAAAHAGLVSAHGERPVLRFLRELFLHWLDDGARLGEIPIFDQLVGLVMGGRSTRDTLGNAPLPYVFIETDGAVEGLDVLKVCGPGMPATSCTVFADGIDRFLHQRSVAATACRGDIEIPATCKSCRESETCGGGYLPHRYRPDVDFQRAFDNPSIWCADLLGMFDLVREHLRIDVSQTRLRREALAAMSTYSERPQRQ